MAASTTQVLPGYHRKKWSSWGKGSPIQKVETIPAAALGYVTAGAPAPNGVSNVWQGQFMVSLATNDEVHYAWTTPFDFDYRYPVYIRWGIYATAASKSITMLTTIDRHSDGDTAADGATALNETIPAITPGQNKSTHTYWGKLNGHTSDFDTLFIKCVATDATTADNCKCFDLQIAYRTLGI